MNNEPLLRDYTLSQQPPPSSPNPVLLPISSSSSSSSFSLSPYPLPLSSPSVTTDRSIRITDNGSNTNNLNPLPPSSSTTTLSSSSIMSNLHRKSNLFMQDMVRAQNPMLVLEYRIGWLNAKYRYMRRAEILYECRKGVLEYQLQHSTDNTLRSSSSSSSNNPLRDNDKAVTLAPEYRGQSGGCRNTIMTLIQPRDLRVIDPEFSGTTVNHQHEPVLLVRRYCVIIAFPHVRAIILADRCYFFPEKGADNELVTILERFHEFGKQYQSLLTSVTSSGIPTHTIGNVGAESLSSHPTVSSHPYPSVSSLPAPPLRTLLHPVVSVRNTANDDELPPFEMYALETFLVQAIATLAKEVNELQPIVSAMMTHVSCGIHNSATASGGLSTWYPTTNNRFGNGTNRSSLSSTVSCMHRFTSTLRNQKALMDAVSIHSFDQIRNLKHKVNDLIHRIEAVERVMSETLDTPQDLASMSLSAIRSIILEENELTTEEKEHLGKKDTKEGIRTTDLTGTVEVTQGDRSVAPPKYPLPIDTTKIVPKSLQSLHPSSTPTGEYHQYVVKNVLDYTHGREHGQSIGTLLQSPRTGIDSRKLEGTHSSSSSGTLSFLTPRRKLLFFATDGKGSAKGSAPTAEPLTQDLPRGEEKTKPLRPNFSPSLPAVRRVRSQRKHHTRRSHRHHHPHGSQSHLHRRKRSNSSSPSSTDSSSTSSSSSSSGRSSSSSSSSSSSAASSKDGSQGTGSVRRHPLSTTATNYDYGVYGEAAEILLEAYLAEIETLLSTSKLMKEEMEGIESQMTLILADARNQLLRVEIWINTVTMCCTFITVIASFFGMNIRNGNEDSIRVFIGVTVGSTVIAGCILITLFGYLRRYMR